ncbi:MAG: YwiC-like family protein [Anaerolineae bacterium]
MSAAAIQPKVNLKNIALPASHGGWGFLLEPVLLGLWLAPSLAGLWLSVAAMGAFLAQQPLKLALTDRRKQRRYPRTLWAERIALLYLGITVMAFGLSLRGAASMLWLLPAALAIPPALVQLYFDAQNRGRELVPELFGAGALGAIAAVVALAGGRPLWPAMALWGIVLARTVGSIIYVRARLRLERSAPFTTGPVWLTHGAAIVAVAAMALAAVAPWLSVLAMVVLLARAVVGLSGWRRAVKPKIVGFQEMGYGFLTVALTVIGFSLGL